MDQDRGGPHRDEEVAGPVDARLGLRGCVAVFGWVAFASVLLLINGNLLLGLTDSLGEDSSSWLWNPRVIQLIVLIGPVVMLIGQWWLVDQLHDRLSSRR